MSRNSEIFWECGPGWGELILPIIKKADELGATIHQIKEKFAQLRVYFSSGIADCDELEDMVDAAALASATLCEMCGATGIRHHNGGWIKTLCKEHATELGFRRKAQ